LLDAVGPDHDKVFRVEVAVSGRVIGVGEGHSRRVAETAAAARAIEALRESPGELAGQTEGAPELIAFGPGEGDDPDDEFGERVNEPWQEIDLEFNGEPQSADGPGKATGGERRWS
jgi:hypothetical protein